MLFENNLNHNLYICTHHIRYNMKLKYYMTIVTLILAILMVGAVSATDQIYEDIISDEDDATLEIEENDDYTNGKNSFSNLSDEIKSAG